MSARPAGGAASGPAMQQPAVNHKARLEHWFLGLTPEQRGRVLSFEDKEGCKIIKQLFDKQNEEGRSLFYDVGEPLFSRQPLPHFGKLKARLKVPFIGRNKQSKQLSSFLEASLKENFCSRTLASYKDKFIYPQRFIEADEQLESSVRLCDTREYLDTVTVESDLLEDGRKFLNLMHVVTRARFLDTPCRVSWTGGNHSKASRNEDAWEWEQPRWFGDMGFYSLGTYIAHKLEMALWMRYWDHHQLDPRKPLIKDGVAVPCRSPSYRFPQYLEGLLSKTYLIDFWKTRNSQERRKIVGSIKNIVQHVLMNRDAGVQSLYAGSQLESAASYDKETGRRKKKQPAASDDKGASRVDYCKLLDKLVDLSSQEQHLGLLFSKDAWESQSERTFITILYFSPLNRAGTPMDTVLRRIGISIVSAYTEKLSMDLIVGEEAEKIKQSAASERQVKKKKKHKPKAKKPQKDARGGATAEAAVQPPLASALSTSEAAEPAATDNVAARTDETVVRQVPAAAELVSVAAPRNSQQQASSGITAHDEPLDALLGSVDPSWAAVSSKPKKKKRQGAADKTLSAPAFFCAPVPRPQSAAVSRPIQAARSPAAAAAAAAVGSGSLSKSASLGSVSTTTSGSSGTCCGAGTTGSGGGGGGGLSLASSAPSALPPSAAAAAAAAAISPVAPRHQQPAPSPTPATVAVPSATPRSPPASAVHHASPLRLSHVRSGSEDVLLLAVVPPPPPAAAAVAAAAAAVAVVDRPRASSVNAVLASLPASSRSLSRQPSGPDAAGTIHGPFGRPSSTPPAAVAATVVSPVAPSRQSWGGWNVRHPSSQLASSLEFPGSVRDCGRPSSATSVASPTPRGAMFMAPAAAADPVPAASGPSDRRHSLNFVAPTGGRHLYHPLVDGPLQRSRPEAAGLLVATSSGGMQRRSLSMVSSSSGSSSPIGSGAAGSPAGGLRTALSASMPVAGVGGGPVVAAAAGGRMSMSMSMSVSVPMAIPPLSSPSSSSSEVSTPEGSPPRLLPFFDLAAPSVLESFGHHQFAGRETCEFHSYLEPHDVRRGCSCHRSGVRGAGNLSPRSVKLCEREGQLAAAASALDCVHPYPVCRIPSPALDLADGETRRSMLSNPVLRAPFVDLDRAIEAFMRNTADVIETQCRPTADRVLQKISKLVSRIWPIAEVLVYGSFATSLCIPSSDLDLVICNIVTSSSDQQTPLRMLASALQSKHWFYDLQVIDTATMPVIKLKSSLKQSTVSIAVDITFREHHTFALAHAVPLFVPFQGRSPHVGLQAAELVQAYLAAMPEVKPLVLVLKQFLYERQLNNSYTGGLGSFALVLMTISFVQHIRRFYRKGDFLPTSSLLVGFFQLYGLQFDYQRMGISVLRLDGSCIEQPGPFFELHMSRFPPAPLVLVDPFDCSRNIGQTAFAMCRVRSAFREAFTELRSQAALSRIIRAIDHYTP